MGAGALSGDAAPSGQHEEWSANRRYGAVFVGVAAGALGFVGHVYVIKSPRRP